MHFFYTLCENYDKLLVINNWTELSIPWGVISSTDVTIVTSSLRNYQKMLEIEFPSKRIPVSRIYNFSKIKKPQQLATYIWYDPCITLSQEPDRADKVREAIYTVIQHHYTKWAHHQVSSATVKLTKWLIHLEMILSGDDLKLRWADKFTWRWAHLEMSSPGDELTWWWAHLVMSSPGDELT